MPMDTLEVLIHQFDHRELFEAIFQNNFINELELTSFKFTAIKCFLKV